MSKSNEVAAMRLALEALKEPLGFTGSSGIDAKLKIAIKTLEEALAKKEQLIKAGADIHAGDGGYSIGTRENYEAFVKVRNESLNLRQGEPDYKALWKQMCERCDELDTKLAKQEQRSDSEHVGEPVEIPEGFSLVAVKGFDELVYWLDRCQDKGHLENCPDLIDPYEAFEYRTIDTTPQQRKPLTDEQISDLWCKTSNTDFVTADTHVFARAIEAAHGIKE